MYVKFDFVTPILEIMKSARRFKADFLSAWATEFVNDEHGVSTEVFSNMIFWNNTAIETDQMKKVYKLLGITVEDINSEDYSGIDYCWYSISPWVIDKSYTSTIINTIINRFSSADVKRFEARSHSKSVYSSTVNNYQDSDAQLVSFNADLAVSNILGITYDIEFNDQFLVLLDTDNEVYNRELIPIGSSDYLDTNGNPSGVRHSSFNIVYSLKDSPVVSQALVDRINNAVKYTDTENYKYQQNPSLYISSIPGQKSSVYEIVVDAIPEDELFVREQVSSGDESGTPIWVNKWVKVDGLKLYQPVVSVKNKANGLLNFGQAVSESVDTGYKKTSVKVWKKVVAGILMIVAIVATAISAGAAAPLVEPVVTAATVALLATVTLVGLSVYEANYGNPNAASAYGNSLSFIGTVTAFIGITALVNKIAEKGITAVMANYAKMSAGKLINTIITMASKVFDFVSNRELKKEQEEIDEMKLALEEQEEIMNDLPTAMRYAAEKWNFETYNFLEINEKMDQVPYNMTQGKVDQMTHKYF